MDFATAVREGRTSQGLSQPALASKAGVSLDAVSDLEVHGRGTVRVLTAVIGALDLRFVGLPRGLTFGDQVRELRRRRSMTQERVAERAGLSPPTIMNVERGNARVAALSAVLKVLAPRARVREPEVTKWGRGERDVRFTPPDIFERIVHVLGRVDLDPCGSPESPVIVPHRFTESEDGLRQRWFGRAFVNPPYSMAAAFTRKAFESFTAGDCLAVVLLLPNSVLHTHIFHEVGHGKADVFILRDRIRFISAKVRYKAPFGNSLVIYGADGPMIERALAAFPCVHLSRSAAIGTGPALDQAP